MSEVMEPLVIYSDVQRALYKITYQLQLDQPLWFSPEIPCDIYKLTSRRFTKYNMDMEIRFEDVGFSDL